MPSRPHGHNAAWRMKSIETSNDLIGIRSRELPACSIVLQPSTTPRAPTKFIVCLIFTASEMLRLCLYNVRKGTERWLWVATWEEAEGAVGLSQRVRDALPFRLNLCFGIVPRRRMRRAGGPFFLTVLHNCRWYFASRQAGAWGLLIGIHYIDIMLFIVSSWDAYHPDF
jgi:hypothetical protein